MSHSQQEVEHIGNSTWNIQCPWFNKNGVWNPEIYEQFIDHLRSGTFGGIKMANKNVYGLAALASRGISNYRSLLRRIKQKADRLDKKHPGGWFLITNGDGKYNRNSVTSIAEELASRPNTIVGFIQSDCGYCEPDSDYWPPYATFGIFGPAVYHNKFKRDPLGEIVMKNNSPRFQECWGGFSYDENGDRVLDHQGIPVMSFVDRVLLPGGELHDIYQEYGGWFIGGGGEITRDQIEIHKIGQDPDHDDLVLAAIDGDGNESTINDLAVIRMIHFDLFKAWNTWKDYN